MSEEVIVGIVLAVVLGAIFVGIAVSEYKKKHRDCKKCGGKNSMTMSNVEEVPKGGNNRIFFRTETWTCGKCGYKEEVKKTVNYGTNAPQMMSDWRRRELYGDDD